MRWFALAFVASMVGFLIWVGIQTVRINDYGDDCAAAGGVAVKSHMGPRVCIDRDALIEVKR